MFKKVLKWIFGIGFAICLFLGIYSFTIMANAPEIDPKNIYDYLSESSILLDDEGNVIESIHLDGGNRTNIDYDQMPQNLIDAIVSIEDKTFWKHKGFNYWRILGAVKDSVFSNKQIGGTSTITQQLARNVYLSESKSVRSINRKITEAYYTVILEKNLSKKEIIEAYLNTIYLGNNSYGVEAASRSYFNKDTSDLELSECIALAALPQAPNTYALVKKKDASEGSSGLDNSQKIIYENSDFIYYYNGDASKHRREATLKLMKENNYITDEEYKMAKVDNMADQLNVSASDVSSGTSYFVDYLISQIVDDLMDKYNYSKEEALNKIYTGGLKIHTSLNSNAQKSIEDAFAINTNFPKNTNIRYNKSGDILNAHGQVSLIKYSNYFNSNDEFILGNDEYKIVDGNIVLLKGKRLRFIQTTFNGKKDYNIEFKDMYQFQNSSLYTIKGGVILVPREYKTLDNDGNLVIDKAFYNDEDIKTKTPDFLKKSGNTYIVPKSCYSLRAKIRQPQAAMVITDYRTGEIKAMVGGREISGKKLYNRAINPRQPGSSIKPLSVYAAALQQGKEAADKNQPMNFKIFDENQNTEYYGDFWTASSGINDAPIKNNGEDWPKNWYEGYKGEMTMRKAIEQSVNTIAVRVYQQVGNEYAINKLEKFGITTVAKDGAINDNNPSALALGGMTKGISPLEMSSAFGTFPNKGERVESITYTRVEDKKDELILASDPEKIKVLDSGIAYIMQDILVSTVNNGIAARANVPGKVTGGKTGTTSDSMDIWFCGFTPQYSAALWIGNDVNITIAATSDAVSRLWSKIMANATSGMSGSLPSKPSDVIYQNGEYFVSGTESGVRFDSSMDGESLKKKEEEERIKEEEKKKEEENQENENENDPNKPTLPEVPDKPIISPNNVTFLVPENIFTIQYNRSSNITNF